MKKYLFIALAALGFAACAEKGEENGPVQKGELEQSYVAITLASNDGTRAENELDKKFEDGTEAESAVQSAHVFFFRDGKAFPVSFSNGSTIEDPQGKNHLSLTLTMNDDKNDTTNSVSDFSNEILVIEKYRGEYPNQVVAVLNWTPTKDNYDIADLQKELLNIQNDEKYFVMCNSVYADEATPKNTIIATPITEANIGTENDLTKLEAVQIYVERLAAKVVFTTVPDPNNGLFDIDQTVVDRSGATPQDIKVYARVEGYELFDAYYDSWLVKQINPNWSNTDLGFTWNDAPNYRSYWADSYTNRSSLAFPVSNSFNWAANPREQYCGENTNTDARTKVVVKATLVDENDKPVEVVNWLGKEYVGEDYLKIVVANTLKEKYFSSTDGKTFSSLEPKDLRCVTRDSNAEKAYYVDFQLSTDANYGVNKKWYVKSANGEYTFITYAEMNAQLMAVHPALVYNDGMTYYYTDIRHLANDTTKVGAYGVVRNHVYKVNITNIDGFGTPIYNGSQDFVKVETPEEIYTYVSAQINILSWRIVDHNYDLGE